MRKKRTNTSGNIEKWKLAFLLDGTWPDRSLGFLGFGFVNGNPLAAWDTIKDGPVVQAWRAANPGKWPFAERLANMKHGGDRRSDQAAILPDGISQSRRVR
jgi:hypothetical protein